MHETGLPNVLGEKSLICILPMVLAFLGTIRFCSFTILIASNRISKRLLIKASNGARGKAATKTVVKLYWITKNIKKRLKRGRKLNYTNF